MHSITGTHGLLLGNPADMAPLRSKKGLIDRGIHLATRRKASTASDDLIMIRSVRPTIRFLLSYLSSSSSCICILSTMEVTISERAEDGMVVRRKEFFSITVCEIAN